MSSVRSVFPQTRVTTDVELLASESSLTDIVMRRTSAAVSQLWYRRVTSTGEVVKGAPPRLYVDFAHDVFRFSNSSAGWLVPNKISIIYTAIWQSLATGRDTVYALSGPDMVGYIGGLADSLSIMYDAVREEVPGLPEVLYFCVVPVAQGKLVAHRRDADAVDAVVDVIAWYERQPPEKRAQAINSLRAIGAQYPWFTRPIAEACFLSHYDLVAGDELYVPTWLIEAPLSRIEYFMSVLDKGRTLAVRAA